MGCLGDRPQHSVRQTPISLYAVSASFPYFEVANSHPPDYTTRVQSQADTLSSRVLQDLAVLEEQQRQGSQILLEVASAKEVSPWLELTRWPDYLGGYHFC